MNRNERLDHHQKFKATSRSGPDGALTDSERLDLDDVICKCVFRARHAYNEYALISTEGMTFLATPAMRKAKTGMIVLRETNCLLVFSESGASPDRSGYQGQVAADDGASSCREMMSTRWAAAAVAACVLISVAIGCSFARQS